jgi:TatD DNase family protein
MLIDTHAHLNFSAYKDDADEVIQHSLENNIWMINVGSQYSTSKRALEIAEKYEKGIYAAVGLHPIHLETGLVKIKEDPDEIQFNTVEESFDYEKYKELAVSKKVVAIGETGFDYYWKPKTQAKLELFKERQRAVLLQHLKLAQELNLPVIFHCRMAHKDLIEILNEQRTKNNEQLRGVIHCFSGDWEEAKKYLEMGFCLGFNGIIFKLNLDEVIEKTPLGKILIETDCPYLTPPQENGRNEPIYVKYVAEKIAKIKNLTFEKIAEITTQNAQKLFNL